MNLTAPQQTALAADINGQASLASARTAHDAPAVINFYNAPGTTQVWRSDITPAQLVAVANWVAFAAKTPQVQNTLFGILLANPIDASQASVRSGFGAIFSGADLTALSNAAQRVATKIEALFGSGGPPIVCGVDAAGLSLFGQALDAPTVALVMGW